VSCPDSPPHVQCCRLQAFFTATRIALAMADSREQPWATTTVLACAEQRGSTYLLMVEKVLKRPTILVADCLALNPLNLWGQMLGEHLSP